MQLGEGRLICSFDTGQKLVNGVGLQIVVVQLSCAEKSRRCIVVAESSLNVDGSSGQVSVQLSQGASFEVVEVKEVGSEIKLDQSQETFIGLLGKAFQIQNYKLLATDAKRLETPVAQIY